MKMLQFPAKDKALKAAARGVGRVRRRPVIREGSRRAGGARRPDRRRSQAGGLGQVDAEAVAPTLVAISAVAWPRWRWTVRSSVPAAVASPARSEWPANSWRRPLSLSVENFQEQTASFR
jgi:hypothetical protein